MFPGGGHQGRCHRPIAVTLQQTHVQGIRHVPTLGRFAAMPDRHAYRRWQAFHRHQLRTARPQRRFRHQHVIYDRQPQQLTCLGPLCRGTSLMRVEGVFALGRLGGHGGRWATSVKPYGLALPDPLRVPTYRSEQYLTKVLGGMAGHLLAEDRFVLTNLTALVASST